MSEKPSIQEKKTRDAIEAPPKAIDRQNFEKPKSIDKNFDSQQNEKIETRPKKTSQKITPHNAHAIAISLLTNPEFVNKLKNVMKEKLVQREKITRLDKAIFDKEIFTKQYGLSREHLVEHVGSNFLNFEIIEDDNELAITFQKITGDVAIRSIDNIALADMLNFLILENPSFASGLTHDTMRSSTK